MSDHENPKEKSAEKPADSAKDTTSVSALKGLLSIDLGTAFALARVPMRAFAQKLAQTVKNQLPKNHWLMGDGTETVIALLADRVEKFGKTSKSKGVEISLEAMTDFIEVFSVTLCGGDDGATGHGKTSEKPKVDREKAASSFDEFDKKFREAAAFRMAAAKTPEDKKRVMVELEEETELHARIKVILTEGPTAKKEEPKAEPPKEPKKPWLDSIEPDLKELEKQNDVWKAENAQMRATPTEEGWLTRLLFWPWRTLAGILFGFPTKATGTETRKPATATSTIDV